MLALQGSFTPAGPLTLSAGRRGANYLWEILSKGRGGVQSPYFEFLQQQER